MPNILGRRIDNVMRVLAAHRIILYHSTVTVHDRSLIHTIAEQLASSYEIDEGTRRRLFSPTARHLPGAPGGEAILPGATGGMPTQPGQGQTVHSGNAHGSAEHFGWSGSGAEHVRSADDLGLTGIALMRRCVLLPPFVLYRTIRPFRWSRRRAFLPSPGTWWMPMESTTKHDVDSFPQPPGTYPVRPAARAFFQSQLEACLGSPDRGNPLIQETISEARDVLEGRVRFPDGRERPLILD